LFGVTDDRLRRLPIRLRQHPLDTRQPGTVIGTAIPVSSVEGIPKNTPDLVCLCLDLLAQPVTDRLRLLTANPPGNQTPSTAALRQFRPRARPMGKAPTILTNPPRATGSTITLPHTSTAPNNSRLLRSHVIAADGLTHLHVARRRTGTTGYELVLSQTHNQ
jgi:hypothetical protein